MSSGSAFELSVVISPATRRPSVAPAHQRPVLERLGSDETTPQTFVEDRPHVARGLLEQTVAVGDINKDSSRPAFDRGFSKQTLSVADADFSTPSGSTPVTPAFLSATPPTDSQAAIIPAIGQLEESKALRGLRVFACCFALFLCGWKSVIASFMQPLSLLHVLIMPWIILSAVALRDLSYRTSNRPSDSTMLRFPCYSCAPSWATGLQL
jgi:hypothetical protein